jgi:lipoprotein-releasing system ATP-binding protein
LSAPIAIRAEALSKVYRSGDTQVTVFDRLALCVSAGERLAIMGESGSGKSTLLHLLGGLDRPTSGNVFLGDVNLTTLRSNDLSRVQNRTLGFVWQNPSLLPEFTAMENVSFPLLIRGVNASEASAIAAQRLDEVGLSRRAHHRAGELSGGEQQRVAVARALAGNPQILLADEPTGSLDDRTASSLQDLLAEMHRRHQLTSIFVTHSPALASRCDRVLILSKGQLTPSAPVEGPMAGVIQDATRLDGGMYV